MDVLRSTTRLIGVGSRSLKKEYECLKRIVAVKVPVVVLLRMHIKKEEIC